MVLKDLIQTLCPDAVQDPEKIDGKLEYPHVKVRLMFSNQDYPELNKVTLPIAHPALIAWYNYEVEFIDIPKKNLVEVSFAKVWCD